MSNWSLQPRILPFLAALLLGLAGCSSLGSGGGRGPIGEVNLFSSPMALSLGAGTAPGAIGIRVYACPAGGSKGIPIREGTLEILMFDGQLSTPDFSAATPLKQWTFTAAQLRDLIDTTSLGQGYQLVLKWEQAQPKNRAVTIVARYRNPAGGVVYSAANSVAVSNK